MFEELQSNIELLEDLKADYNLEPTMKALQDMAVLDRRIVYLEEILKHQADDTLAA